MTNSIGSSRVPQPGERTFISTADAAYVSTPVRIAAAWSWRLIVILVALIPVGWLIAQAKIIVIPLLAAILVTALVVPLTNRLTGRLGWPKWLAMIAGLLAIFAAFAALIGLAVLAVRTGQRIEPQQLQDQLNNLLVLVRDSPFHITESQITEALRDASTWVRDNLGTLLQGTLSAGTTLATVAAGVLVTVFAVIFYLLDGRRIWLFVVSLFPKPARAALDGAAERGWVTVGHYVRVQVLVAFVDALGIFLGALILNVPYALAIGIIVFIVAFIPYVGAIISGMLACALALIANGFWNAVIMLVVVVLVLQLEAHVLQPLIMGSAVKLHPLAVLVSVSAGSLFAGIAGAVFAVPVVAVANVMIRYIASRAWRGLPDPTEGMHEPVSEVEPASVTRRRAQELRERLTRNRSRSSEAPRTSTIQTEETS